MKKNPTDFIEIHRQFFIDSLKKGTIAISFNSQLWEMEWVAGSQCPSKKIILSMVSIFLHINRCKHGAFGKYTTAYQRQEQDQKESEYVQKELINNVFSKTSENVSRNERIMKSFLFPPDLPLSLFLTSLQERYLFVLLWYKSE